MDNGILVENNIPTPKIETTNSLNIKDLSKDKLDITLYNKSIINVIKVIPNKLETIHLREPISSPSNKFITDIEKDLLKVAVIERHKGTGNVGVGIINGMELKSGAIATTIAHDSHNLIVVGTNDSDMLFATEKLKEIGGGIIVVEDGKVLSSIKLEIGGLITDRPINSIMNDLEELHNSIKKVAPTINFNPFLTLSFLSLPVIPDIKITDKGIFDVKKFDFIDIAQ